VKKKLLLCFFCFLCVTRVTGIWAADFGLILDVTPGAGDYGTGNKFDFSGILIPRFSVLLGNNGEIFISAGISADYQNESWSVIPEILRTEFTTRFNNLELKLGRTQYADPLGFIADGLFDGARISLDTDELGSFSLGTWYTGLLNKNRVKITMTREELEYFYTETDYSNFADTYFAPRRLIVSLGWEHPGLGEIVRAKAAFISQSDLGDSGLHSQYLAARFTVPGKFFVFDFGGCLEFIQNDGETALGMAGELGVSCNLPGRIEDRLSITGRFSSGTIEDSVVTAFLPITTISHGDVLKAKLSGLSMLTLDYLARLHRTFSAGVSASEFIRSDLATYSNYGSEGYWLGNEFFGRLVWSPVSDVQINLGGGIFLPVLGDVSPQSAPLWRVELNIILALY
jgi:hypothetical protein